jgi:hypothetical protein
MQRELGETRMELQKGILEMPSEAIEATSAMRSAIAEQIEAISELSKIIARSTGEAAPARPALPQATAPAPLAARSEPPPPPPPAPAAPRTTASEPFGRPANGTPAAAETKVAEAPAPAPAAAKPAGRRGNGEARGWVADLLRRASSDEPAAATGAAKPEIADVAVAAKRSPAQVVESLNSLSIDIARAIDHEASVELWDRYKRGERNVFTRRLYTLQGQKTFDELRRKYEKDGDFRRAVDNYIGDFERLLAQVSKDDTDPKVSRMYLTSDTGKVYTMLAHAAGRLN